jgi:hypothetical protein
VVRRWCGGDAEVQWCSGAVVQWCSGAVVVVRWVVRWWRNGAADQSSQCKRHNNTVRYATHHIIVVLRLVVHSGIVLLLLAVPSLPGSIQPKDLLNSLTQVCTNERESVVGKSICCFIILT